MGLFGQALEAGKGLARGPEQLDAQLRMISSTETNSISWEIQVSSLSNKQRFHLSHAAPIEDIPGPNLPSNGKNAFPVANESGQMAKWSW